MTKQKFYLQPLGLLRGCIDSSRYFKKLNAGNIHFSVLKVIEREGDQIKNELVPVSNIDNYLATKNNVVRASITAILKNLTTECPSITLENGKTFDWNKPIIQGVLNVTPDSFSDGGSFDNYDAAIKQAQRMINDGADIIDIGGESTRPGAVSVSIEQELSRVIPVIEKLSSTTTSISIDSRNARVMSEAITAGAHIVNDVSALSHDPKSLELVQKTKIPVILMHAQGTPETMQENPSYNCAILDIYDYLEDRIAFCEDAGISRNQIIVDPGIGFGKTLIHNMEILANLSIFHGLGVPILVGASRKRFIGEISGEENPKERTPGSISAAISAIEQGVQIVRVHDVKETKQAKLVNEAIHRNNAII